MNDNICLIMGGPHDGLRMPVPHGMKELVLMDGKKQVTYKTYQLYGDREYRVFVHSSVKSLWKKLIDSYLVEI